MTKQHFAILIFILLIMSGLSRAQEGVWTKKADSPELRYAHSASVVNGKIYVMGGTINECNTTMWTLYEYDPTTDTWARKADMSTGRCSFGTSVVNGKIYAVGGAPTESTLEEYDPIADKWTRKASVPTGRYWVSTSVVNGKIYAIGGATGNYNRLSAVEEYDPFTEQWKKKADMPTLRTKLSTSVVNGKIYAIGGSVSIVEEYDPVTDVWTKKSDMPAPRGATATCVAEGRIYVIGGEGNDIGDRDFVEKQTVWIYDPLMDKWTEGPMDMPTPRSFLSTNIVNGKIYAIGGWGYPLLFGIGLEHQADLDNGNISAALMKEFESHGSPLPSGAKIVKAPYQNASRWIINSSGSGWSEFNALYLIRKFGDHINVYDPLSGKLKPLKTVEVYDTGTKSEEYGSQVAIRVQTVSPQEGRMEGGEPIAIFGSGFPPEAVVTIDGNPLTGMEVTDTLITGFTPPGTEGEADILITAPVMDYSIPVGKFFYRPPSSVVVTRMTPANGKLAGGDLGSIAGMGFMPGATVTIGGISATNVGVTPTLITFTIPPGTEGTKDVVVTNPDGQKATLKAGYTYNPFPLIEKVEPKYGGPLAGYTQVTIVGRNFMPGAYVAIGDNRVNQIDFFSPTEIRLKSPPGSEGKKPVKVANPDGQDAILEDGFTYNPSPYISSIEPNMGTMEGGIRVTIMGGRFIYPLQVFFEDAEADVQDVAAERIIAKTTLSTAGVKDVTVINPDRQRYVLEEAFTYNPAPGIVRITPDNGRLAGGTKITITGDGFLPGARVLFGKTGESYMAASSVEVMSGTIINSITPPGSPGPKDVMVENPDRQIIILPNGYTYNPIPTISRITPDYGSSSGGTKIVVEGTGFLPGVRLMIGEKTATAQLKDDMTIEAITPSNQQGVWDVRVVNPDTQEVVKPGGFITVGELAYNYPNPFRASQGTTFRYVTNETVNSITVKIFNMAGVPIDMVRQDSSNEVRWQDSDTHAGMYLYVMEINLGNGEKKQFKKTLEVYK